MVKRREVAPGKPLYTKVRVNFIQRGTTLTAWCETNGVIPSNARAALMGSWNGPKAKKLRAALIAAAGVEPDQFRVG